MRFRVLALDFDGTIALDGRLDPEVAKALAELRAEGVAVVIVTGRILNDLRCRLGSLRAFDAVVAEEGAVLAFPQSGTSRLLAPPPPPELLEALRKHGLTFLAGQCLVECEATLAPVVLSTIRALELPLVIHFNRGRMMILSQAVSKATGLEETLRTLRLSAHDTLAIGDAENDHQLLATSEVGVAVSWGSAALRRAADLVLEGEGPPAVADFVRAQLRAPERLAHVSRRHRLLLGRRKDDGQEASMFVRGRNLLVTGDPLSGKSWLAGLLAEQLVLQGYSLCLVDAEGDYSELGALPGMRLLGGDDALPSARDLARLFAYPDASAVIDLSRLPKAEKPSYVSWLIAQLTDLRRRSGLPHRVVIDEAHYFLHQATEAEKSGFALGGWTLVSYQASRVDRALLKGCAVFVTRETDPREIELLRALCGGQEDADAWSRVLGTLEVDEAVLLPGAEESAERFLSFRLAPRLTRHVRHEHKYLDAPLAEHLAFRFAPSARLGELRARSLREFTDRLECARVGEIDGHLRRGDYSTWVRAVFRDHALAERLAELEELYRLGRLPDVNGALIHAVHQRYRLSEEPGPEGLPA